MDAAARDLVVEQFPGYRLLDSGRGDKLEEIAGQRVVRPCPQALWRPRLDEAAWSAAPSRCVRTRDGGGYWEHTAGDPGEHLLRRPVGGTTLEWAVRFTAFGHCGVFFEQAVIWDRIAARLAGRHEARFANLFGYTGCASLVAAASGAQVFHVDSARGVLDWGRGNARRSGLPRDAVQWIQDDVRSFLKLSRKRGFRYDGILVDPPSWGHGAGKGGRGKKAETWVFERDLAALVAACCAVLSDRDPFLVLTCHTPGVQHAALATVLGDAAGTCPASGDLGVRHADDARVLPAGVYAAIGL
ncbi:MAG: class I SAM-dependent methyltransferase [Planctomycetota bacterium]